MEGVILGVLLWLGCGYLSGEFIIRWNQRHLFGDHVSPKKLKVANFLNANLVMYQSTSVREWRVILTIMGPITLVKAVLLRLCDGPA